MVLAEPLRVSPLIKVSYWNNKRVSYSFFIFQTCRWGALIAGIWWGGKRFAANKAAEDEVSFFSFSFLLFASCCSTEPMLPRCSQSGTLRKLRRPTGWTARTWSTSPTPLELQSQQIFRWLKSSLPGDSCSRSRITVRYILSYELANM